MQVGEFSEIQAEPAAILFLGETGPLLIRLLAPVPRYLLMLDHLTLTPEIALKDMINITYTRDRTS